MNVSRILFTLEEQTDDRLNQIKNSVLTWIFGQRNIPQTKRENRISIDRNQKNCSYLNVFSQESFSIRGEKAKAKSNENETYVFSWMTAQKNLVETRGKNWWVRVWSNMYFLTWVIGHKHIRDSKTDVSLPVERSSRRSGSSLERCRVQSWTEDKSRYWSVVWVCSASHDWFGLWAECA